MAANAATPGLIQSAAARRGGVAHADAERRTLRIVVVTLHTREVDHIHAITSQARAVYCGAHGYPLVDVSVDEASDYVIAHSPAWTSEARAPHFAKLAAVALALERTGADWALWQDTDALFLNHNFRLADVVDDRYDMIVPALLHTNRSGFDGVPNTGALLVRNTPSAIDLLRRIYNIGINRRHVLKYYDQVRVSSSRLFDDGRRQTLTVFVRMRARSLVCGRDGPRHRAP